MKGFDASIGGVFEDVAIECYARVQKLTELRDREGAEVAERALELVLFGERTPKEPELLFGDVMRNARFSVRRSAARREAIIAELGHLARANVSTGASRGFVQADTPEDLAVAHELAQHLHEEACRCGDYGELVLTGLLAGSTIRETAVLSGVSTATVDRTVRRLRAAVETAGYRDAT